MKRLIAWAFMMVAVAAALPGTAAAQKGQPAALVGVWGINGDCNTTFTLNADGTAAIGGGQGYWDADASYLKVVIRDETIPTPYKRVGNDTLEVDGGKLVRCTAAAKPVAARAPARAVTATSNPAWMAGTWSPDDECKQTFGLRADGTVVTADGGSTWYVDGTTLVMIIDGETISRKFLKAGDDIQIVDGPLLMNCAALH